MRRTLTLLGALVIALSAVPLLHAADPAPGAGEAEVDNLLQPVEGDDDLLINREKYFYSSFGRRDPFGSLIKGKFASTEDGDLLDIGQLNLVGVVWGDADKFAVVEDQRGRSSILRVGDRVVNGKITKITQTSVTAQHYFFGETANVTIYLQEGEER